jgi:glycosyltransferase involved in cell wall biosynthesis
LFVHGQLPGETGSGVYLQQITAEAVRQGIDIYVLSAGYHPLNSADIPGVPDQRIYTCLFTPEGKTPHKRAVKTPISGMSVVMPYPVLAYRDRTEDEILDLLTVFGSHITKLAYELKPNVIHVNHLWFLGGLARLAAPWIPLIVSAHGTANKLILDAPRFRELVVPCVSSADHVCAISPESVLECKKIFEIPEDRISIEGYGYEPELFYCKDVDRREVFREKLNFDVGRADHLALSVGKFADWKGFKEFALAIGHLRDRGYNISGVIVGEGDSKSRAELMTFINENHLANQVFLPGKVGRGDLPDIYRAADVFVLSSHVEPYGLVLMEALACGTPAVFGNVGGPPSYVPHGLRAEQFVVAVDPIKLTGEGLALPEDRSVYAINLADGIETILQRKFDLNDRIHIADAMKFLSWGRLVNSLSKIYDKLSKASLSKMK